jgi:hypothetical protein
MAKKIKATKTKANKKPVTRSKPAPKPRCPCVHKLRLRVKSAINRFFQRLINRQKRHGTDF